MRKEKKNVERKEIPDNSRVKFVVELIFAILLSVSCALIGMSNLLWASNDLYPGATDILGHMTKVAYLKDQLSQGHFASWFPYWYNGSSVTQYYVPLSYYLMVPVYWITDNLMLTYKIFCGSVMAIGSFGVWVFCYKKIGRVCGLFGILAFSFQPLLLSSLYREGVIAQGPIFAIMPWFLLLILSCARKPSKGNFAGSTILTTLMILSHAMHAFMVCFTTLLVLLIFVVIRKVKLKDFIIAALTIVFSGVFTAFWSVVGVTGFENPGVPYLLPEAAAYTTAEINWFIPDSGAFFYYSIIITALSLLGLLCYLIAAVWRKNSDNQRFFGLACIILTVVTTAFSFGMKLPGFRYLPFASGMVPGRILTYTAVVGAITAAYAIYQLWTFPKVKYVLAPVSLAILGYMCFEMNPYLMTYQTVTADSFHSMKAVSTNQADAFDIGRYEWYGSVDSSETIFAYEKNLNICKGVNIEGTPHYREIYNSYIALPIKQNDYLMKQLAYQNVRYLLLSDEYEELGKKLEESGFVKSEDNRVGLSLYTSNEPSSYYLTDPRNALVVSNGMQGFSIEFPNFVQGKSAELSDYTDEELLKYRLIYIIEPKIDTQSRKDRFEAIVTKLVNAGITVMIEPVPSKIFDLFGVSAQDDISDTSDFPSPQLTATPDSPIVYEASTLQDNSNLRMLRSLAGLDKVYANFTLENGNVNNPVLGSKKVGNGEVIFVGAHLSQYLESVYTRNNGLYALTDTVKSNSALIDNFYKELLSCYNVNQEYLPRSFERVTNQKWDYQGGTFSYSSAEANEITVSVTYSPRWKATLDGKELEVSQRENMITLWLPSGVHTVVLHYGMTVYGIAGYVISGIGIIAFILFLLLWNRNMRLISGLCDGVVDYLQIYDSPVSKTGEDDAEAPLLTAAALEENNQPDSKPESDEREDQEEESTVSDASYIYQEIINEDGIKVDIIEIEDDDEELIDKTEENNLRVNEEKTGECFEENTAKITDAENEVSYQADTREPDQSITETDSDDNQEVLVNVDYDVYDEILQQAIIQNEAKKKTGQISELEEMYKSFKQNDSKRSAAPRTSSQTTTKVIPLRKNSSTAGKGKLTKGSKAADKLLRDLSLQDKSMKELRKKRRNAALRYSKTQNKKQYIILPKKSK